MNAKERQIAESLLKENWKHLADNMPRMLEAALADAVLLPEELERATVFSFGQFAAHYSFTLKGVSGKEMSLYVPEAVIAMANRQGLAFSNPHNFFQYVQPN